VGSTPTIGFFIHNESIQKSLSEKCSRHRRCHSASLLHALFNRRHRALIDSMATLAKSFVFDRLSFFIAECASPKKKVAILSTSCEEIAFFGESARVYRAIVTVHTVGKGPLCEIPHLN